VATYVEFRLVVSPDLATQGNWSVTVDDCPIPGLIGPKGGIVKSCGSAPLDDHAAAS
jgi:hypothetical protein